MALLGHVGSPHRSIVDHPLESKEIPVGNATEAGRFVQEVKVAVASLD